MLTFDTVYINVINAHNSDLGFGMIIRVHLHRDSIESVKSLLKKFAEVLRGDGKFSFHMRSISRLGGPNDDRIHPADDGVEEVREYARSLRLKLLELSLPYICCASWLNS
ncbi:hypothetical protein [Vulcanisaeta sp. JCM 16159]|uniref:hypothetical protein n=1 Tax=Vulcanisaeta sp. JCM 16159 TaxID=1295371 RepID=UPI000B139C0D|nr:hypothetical protein [Vulcanisaeta sp. JCM 16159]